MVEFFFAKYMANDAFSEPPLTRRFQKSHFHFLPIFGSESPPVPGVSLSRILGVPSIEPLLGEGGV